MLIYTARFSKRKAVAILLALAVIAAAVILLFPEKEAGTGMEVFGKSEAVRYIESLGYTAGEKMESGEVVIPETFDEVYTGYNNMQKECGFDLEPYKGEKVTLYSCCIEGYPDQSGVMCDILVYEGEVIGGNIYTAELDGFMHGLKPAEG